MGQKRKDSDENVFSDQIIWHHYGTLPNSTQRMVCPSRINANPSSTRSFTLPNEILGGPAWFAQTLKISYVFRPRIFTFFAIAKITPDRPIWPDAQSKVPCRSMTSLSLNLKKWTNRIMKHRLWHVTCLFSLSKFQGGNPSSSREIGKTCFEYVHNSPIK